MTDRIFVIGLLFLSVGISIFAAIEFGAVTANIDLWKIVNISPFVITIIGIVLLATSFSKGLKRR